MFGDVHSTGRTAGSTLFINALMTLYWCFRLDPVAQRVLYLDAILHTGTIRDLTFAIEQFRATLPTTKSWINLPV